MNSPALTLAPWTAPSTSGYGTATGEQPIRTASDDPGGHERYGECESQRWRRPRLRSKRDGRNDKGDDGAEGPSADRVIRQDEQEAIEDDAAQEWKRLDQAFYEYPEDLASLLRDYVRQHANEIRE